MTQLLRVADWRGLFWLLLAYGCVILVAAVLVASRTSVVLDRRVDDDPAPLEVLAGLAQGA